MIKLNGMCHCRECQSIRKLWIDRDTFYLKNTRRTSIFQVVTFLLPFPKMRLTSDEVNEYTSYECSEYMYAHMNIHPEFQKKIAPKIASKNFKCNRAWKMVKGKHWGRAKVIFYFYKRFQIISDTASHQMLVIFRKVDTDHVNKLNFISQIRFYCF